MIAHCLYLKFWSVVETATENLERKLHVRPLLLVCMPWRCLRYCRAEVFYCLRYFSNSDHPTSIVGIQKVFWRLICRSFLIILPLKPSSRQGTCNMSLSKIFLLLFASLLVVAREGLIFRWCGGPCVHNLQALEVPFPFTRSLLAMAVAKVLLDFLNSTFSTEARSSASSGAVKASLVRQFAP